MTASKRLSGLLTAASLVFPLGTLLPQAGWSADTDEIVVTTRRREENVQEVPIAINAIGSAQLERQGVRDMFDLAQLDPSVQMDAAFAPSDTKITVRGLTNTRGRSNVAFLVDGIDVTTENLGLPGSGLLANMRLLNDVERVEVIKGPQSALFGRAAFSGAISYTTKDPTEEFAASVGTDVAEFGQRQLNGSVSGPISDTLGYRLDGVLWTADGFYKNSISGSEVGGGEGMGLSGTLKWEPSDALSFKGRVAYSEDEYRPRAQVRVPARDLVLYPQNVIDAGIGEPGFWIFRQTSSGTGGPCPGVPAGEPCNADPTTDFSGVRGLTLRNHGRFCPNNPAVDDRSNTASPGFCVTRNLGDLRNPMTGQDYIITHSENVLTGGDYEGFTQDVLRISLRGDWDVGAGTVTSLTGFTDADDTDSHDSDYEAIGRPDRMLSNWVVDRQGNTKQFSQEFRFATDNEGPLNFTGGLLYWKEERTISDANYIVACLPVARDRSAPGQSGVTDSQLDPESGPIQGVPGICDGNSGGLSPSGMSVGGANTDFLVWQPIVQQLAQGATRVPPVNMNADTDHLSFYGMVEWEINEQWTLAVENRYVTEEFDLLKPNQSSCDKLGFAAATGATTNDPSTALAFNPLLDANSPTSPANFENLCTWENQAFDPMNTWELVGGKSSSRFHTPKATLQWFPSDDNMFYLSYARAQKPAGISTFISGGRATSLEDERFDSEKMNAWEFGGKMSGEAAGQLIVNFAAFFQDYTDKQVGTQVLVDGILTPKIENAAAAEVLGLELEATWQPAAIDGMTLAAAYTWLDPTFTRYIDDTTSQIRAATHADLYNGCSAIVYKDGEGPNPTDLSDPANGGPNCRLDLSGFDLELTPRNAFVASVNVTRPLFATGLDWVLDVNTSYQDKRFESQDNYLYLDEYWLTNARVGVIGSNWSVLLYVDNVFDDDTLKTASSAPDFGRQVSQLGFLAGLGVSNTTATLPDPRVFGIRANVSFGAD